MSDDDTETDQHGHYTALQITITKDPKEGTFGARILLADHLHTCHTCRAVAIATAVAMMGTTHHALAKADNGVEMVEDSLETEPPGSLRH